MTAPKGQAISLDEQLTRWVGGESIHRIGETVLEDHCTPDFSCCDPELQQPKEIREAFAAADERTRDRFLMTFLGALGALVATVGNGKKVAIIGDDPESQS